MRTKIIVRASCTAVVLAMSMAGFAGAAQATAHKSGCTTFTFFGFPVTTCTGGNTGQNNNIGLNCVANNSTGCVNGHKP